MSTSDKEYPPTPVSHLSIMPYLGIDVHGIQHYNWNELVPHLETVSKECKKTCNFKWGNDITHLIWNGELYTVMFELVAATNPKNRLDHGVCQVDIWHYRGTPKVGRVQMHLKEDGRPVETSYDDLKTTLRDFSAGKRVCGKCQKKMVAAEVAGTIYAGVYCKACTDTTWYKQEKALEGT